MTRAEESLRHAFFVSVITGGPAIPKERVKEEIVRHFELPVSSVTLTPAEPEDFLLVLPDEQKAAQVYGDGRPIRAATFRLHLRRWSRQAHAEAGSLRVLVNLTIKGVPQHAWNLRTAEHLLNNHCWVLRLLPETADRSKLASFKLMAWCSHPDAIPSAKVLEIVEPPTEEDEWPPIKRSLCYNVSISSAVIFPAEEKGAPDLSSSSERDDQGPRRQRRRRSPSPPPPADGSSDGRGVQIPVHDRLGPRAPALREN